MKKGDTLLEIKSLEHRMNHPMTLDEAEKFNAELFKKNFSPRPQEPIENYKFEYDELMEYCLLQKSDTGLPVYCFADDGGSWKRRNHPLWFLMVNGYDKTDEVIPFTVSDYPKMVGQYDLKVSKGDINKVMNFIIQNRKGLTALGNNEISNDEFEDNMDTFQYHMAESVEERGMINEMAKIRADLTGLPTDIWVDEFQTYKKGKHGPRIKFMAVQGESNSDEYPSMSISDEPVVFKMPSKTFLRNRDIREIMLFVINNKELLLLLSDGKISRREFTSRMIPNT